MRHRLGENPPKASFHRSLALSVLAALVYHSGHTALAAEIFCVGGVQPDPAVIWCDSFEDADLGANGTIGEKYFEFDNNGGDFARTTSEKFHGNHSLRARWQAGESEAGNLKLNFGRNPLPSQTHAQQDFREIYWRFYFKLQQGFVGHPDKLTRATIFATTNWAQAMVAHLWADSGARQFLLLDPVSGVNNQGQLVTTKWNDFNNFSWLGGARGSTALAPGRWYCVETHVRLNDPGQSNGVFEYWLDGNLEARQAQLNWVKTWSAYGINSILVETFWNDGSPTIQERYVDAFVVATRRIGCIDSIRPNPPSLIVR